MENGLLIGIMLIAIYIVICVLMGLWGKSRVIGGWITFGLAVFCTPLAAFFVILLTEKK